MSDRQDAEGLETDRDALWERRLKQLQVRGLLPDPLPWGTEDEVGLHVVDVAAGRFTAKVFCGHPRRPDELVALVDKKLIVYTHDSLATPLGDPHRSTLGTTCPACGATWSLVLAELRARLTRGSLTRILVQTVGVKVVARPNP